MDFRGAEMQAREAADRIADKNAEIVRLRMENEQLLRFLDFANLWCNRKSNISAKERLEAIQFHPIARKRLKEAGALPE